MFRPSSGLPAPPAPRGVDLFWQRVYVPAYNVLPWRLRAVVMKALPGSHRRTWHRPEEAQVLLGPPLGPPGQARIAEEGAVLGVVGLGLPVPPGTHRTDGLLVGDGTPVDPVRGGRRGHPAILPDRL